MVVIGDVIVAKIIEKLVEIGFDYAADQYFAPDTQMKQELERLKKALPRIKAVVEMAESGQLEISGGLNEWLWELKDAVHKADDALDELDYLRLQKHVEAKTAGSKGHGHSGSKGNDQSKAHGFFSASKRKFIKFSKRVFKSDPTLEKLREAIKRLDEVATSVGSFSTALKECKQLNQQQTQGASSSRETERKVFGRHKEREELLQWLKDEDESSNNVSLFSIVGHGGVGKTTLAQLVYNDESLAISFNRKIWVCISTPFDVKKAMTGNRSDDVQQRDGVMSVLRLSYHHLPVHLRSCFAYCSIFPQDYMFIKDDLVFMWMALGFIQQSPQYPMETPEDIGRRYFDDLLKLSFLEQYYYTYHYNMHDLLHDLARKVSHDECFRFIEDMKIDQIPNTVRHLYFKTDKLSLLRDVDKWKNLRTLVLIFRGYVDEHDKAFEKAFGCCA